MTGEPPTAAIRRAIEWFDFDEPGDTAAVLTNVIAANLEAKGWTFCRSPEPSTPDDPENQGSEPVIVRGTLGWSNKRGGTEFYSTRGEGRWGSRRVADPDDQWGDLLVDELEEAGAFEGAKVLVVAVNRFGVPDLDAVENAIRDALAALLKEAAKENN